MRVRLSSHGVARRIADQYSLPSISDGIEAACAAWDMLTDEQRAIITGAEHETPQDPELEVDEEEEDAEENGSLHYYTAL